MAIYKYQYNKVVNTKIETDTEIISYSPILDEMDYKNGYFIRYFSQKTNDKNGYIYEVDSTTYTKLIENPFYTSVSLRWRISGTNEEIAQSNSKSVSLVAKIIPALPKRLGNLFQFKQ